MEAMSGNALSTLMRNKVIVTIPTSLSFLV
jgi:hypothetical protein